jgi:hypothetical protein
VNVTVLKKLKQFFLWLVKLYPRNLAYIDVHNASSNRSQESFYFVWSVLEGKSVECQLRTRSRGTPEEEFNFFRRSSRRETFTGDRCYDFENILDEKKLAIVTLGQNKWPLKLAFKEETNFSSKIDENPIVHNIDLQQQKWEVADWL